MYLCPKEIAMLKSKEIRSLMGEYRKVFNERVHQNKEELV